MAYLKDFAFRCGVVGLCYNLANLFQPKGMSRGDLVGFRTDKAFNKLDF